MEFVTQCNLCLAKDARDLFVVNDYNIVECCSCGLVYRNPRPTAAELETFYQGEFYKVVKDYADSLIQSSTQINEHDEAKVEQISKAVSRSSGKVLDVGCGAGRLLRVFKEAGWKCYGIEPDPKMATHTRDKIGAVVFEGILENTTFPSSRFDAITACDVLEHVHNPNGFIHQCQYLLKTGGVLLIQVPDFGSHLARKQKEKWPHLGPGHLHHFTTNTLTQMLNRNGFKIRKIQRHGGMGILQPSGVETAEHTAQNEMFANKLKKTVFNTRQILYRSDRLKSLIRTVYWEIMRMNNEISVLSQKVSSSKESI
jgi:2-polyprenyl-3-methyl-5-hydroxy-6-metoxy-1,4-benzoquinol methylase